MNTMSITIIFDRKLFDISAQEFLSPIWCWNFLSSPFISFAVTSRLEVLVLDYYFEYKSNQILYLIFYSKNQIRNFELYQVGMQNEKFRSSFSSEAVFPIRRTLARSIFYFFPKIVRSTFVFLVQEVLYLELLTS